MYDQCSVIQHNTPTWHETHQPVTSLVFRANIGPDSDSVWDQCKGISVKVNQLSILPGSRFSSPFNYFLRAFKKTVGGIVVSTVVEGLNPVSDLCSVQFASREPVQDEQFRE